MDPNISTQLYQRCHQLLQPHMGSGKYTTLYFQPDDVYADSWIRAYRKGGSLFGLGRPAPGARTAYIELSVTFKPGAAGSEWVGYTLCIENTAQGPVLSPFASKWLQAGGEEDADAHDVVESYGRLLDRLLQRPASPNPFPREAPEDMF